MSKNVFLIALIVMQSFSAVAGVKEVGNGGDAVVCTHGGKKTAVLLDYYEATTMRGIKIDLGPSSLSVDEKVQLALARLRVIDSAKADRYAKRIATFNSDAQFLSGYKLPDISDSKHVMLPSECKIEQLVIQRQFPPRYEAKFLVDEDIWNLLDNTSKAGILLHEAVYEQALENGVTNSVGTRYFNSKMSSSLTEFDTPVKANCLFLRTNLTRGAMVENFEKCTGY